MKINDKEIDGIIFDLDGTLFDSGFRQKVDSF